MPVSRETSRVLICFREHRKRKLTLPTTLAKTNRHSRAVVESKRVPSINIYTSSSHNCPRRTSRWRFISAADVIKLPMSRSAQDVTARCGGAAIWWFHDTARLAVPGPCDNCHFISRTIIDVSSPERVSCSRARRSPEMNSVISTRAHRADHREPTL